METYQKDLLNRKGKVYLASGWFNPAQLERCEWARDALKSLGFEVFSPKDENLVTSSSAIMARKQAYDGNIEAIKEASFMFCITNEKDMGTIHESGYASAVGCPIVYFAEGLNGPFNLMLAQSGVHVITSRDQFYEDMQNEAILESILINKPINNFSGEIE